LNYAFKEGIVHRDIKPANIIGRPRTTKDLGFGAGSCARPGGADGVHGLALSTCRPSRFRGDRLTYHSDMYSLGVVLYELLTGQRPFPRRDKMER